MADKLISVNANSANVAGHDSASHSFSDLKMDGILLNFIVLAMTCWKAIFKFSEIHKSMLLSKKE